MKCPIVPNWSFRKDGSCEREYRCVPQHITICKPIRKKRVTALNNITALRDKMRKSIPSIKDSITRGKMHQKLEVLETQISEMHKS